MSYLHPVEYFCCSTVFGISAHHSPKNVAQLPKRLVIARGKNTKKKKNTVFDINLGKRSYSWKPLPKSQWVCLVYHVSTEITILSASMFIASFPFFVGTILHFGGLNPMYNPVVLSTCSFAFSVKLHQQFLSTIFGGIQWTSSPTSIIVFYHLWRNQFHFPILTSSPWICW